MKLFTKRLAVELTNGEIYEVRALSITKTEEFKATYNLLQEELTDEAYKELNFIQSYSARPLAKKYFDGLLSLAGLSVENLSVDSIERLLFPHQLEDGSYNRQGDLIKFICGELSDGDTNVPKEEVDLYASLLAQLWIFHQDFDKAVSMLDTINYDDLATLLKAKVEAEKPAEQKLREKATKKAKEAITARLKTGTFEIGEEIDINSLIN
jgi:hypothetical protein